MELKMYRFGDPIDGAYWICHEDQEKAINLYKETFGEDIYNELIEFHNDEDNVVIEEPMDNMFSYFHDGVNEDRDTFRNHIKKYCSKPDIFACNEY